MRANAVRDVVVSAFAVGAAVLGAAVSVSAQESQIVPGAVSTPPPPSAPRTVQYPMPVATTLPNGLRVIAVRVSGSALVAADLTLPSDALAELDGIAAKS